jgi:hypothetical protein
MPPCINSTYLVSVLQEETMHTIAQEGLLRFPAHADTFAGKRPTIDSALSVPRRGALKGAQSLLMRCIKSLWSRVPDAGIEAVIACPRFKTDADVLFGMFIAIAFPHVTKRNENP